MPDTDVQQDNSRSDDEHEDVGEVHRVLVTASTTAERQNSRSRSDSNKSHDGSSFELVYPDYNILADVEVDMDNRETEHLATDNQCDNEPAVSNDEDEDERTASGHKHDDDHVAPRHQRVKKSAAEHRDDRSSSPEYDELESDNEDELDRADTDRRPRGQAQHRSSTLAVKKLKESGAICVQWPGSVSIVFVCLKCCLRYREFSVTSANKPTSAAHNRNRPNVDAPPANSRKHARRSVHITMSIRMVKLKVREPTTACSYLNTRPHR